MGDLYNTESVAGFLLNSFIEDNKNMPRPRSQKSIRFKPSATFFKPRGVPMRDLEVIMLSHEEVEALRLKNLENLCQHGCACQMNTSQSTVQRLLTSAYSKISQAIIEGKALEIEEKNS